MPAFPSGWHHVTATRAGGQLRLFIDGKQVAASTPFNPADYDLNVDAPLLIGSGENDFFCGQIADVRLYDRVLQDAEVERLAGSKD